MPPAIGRPRTVNKPTAWAFCAVSSNPQEGTLDAQLAWAKSTAQRNGWKITRTFRGVGTGKAGTRKLFDDLLAALRDTPKAERPVRILMVRIDRLGRGTGLEVIGALAELRKLGTTVHTREDGDVKIERASETILPAIRSIVAALENETRADRVRAGQARRRAAGKHLGTVAYGTVLVDGKPVAYEPEAVIVREIFELIAQGWGLERIAGHVRDKAPPKLLRDGSERRMTWSPATIRSLYRSVTVRAVVVDEPLLARAERARASNERYRPTGAWAWPLRGAVRCTCGHLLMGHATGVNPYRVRYYRCRSHPYDERPAGNRRPGYRADRLEQAFVTILHALADDPTIVLSKASKTTTDRLERQETALRAQLTRLDRRRRRACELAEDGIYSSAELRERLDRIDTERRSASAQLTEVTETIASSHATQESSEKLSATLKRLPVEWPTLPIAEQQTIAKAVSAAVGGLYVSPSTPGILKPKHVALRHKARIRNSCRCNRKYSIR